MFIIYDDIIAFGDKGNPTYYKLKLKSDTRVFKQLANYGDVLTELGHLKLLMI